MPTNAAKTKVARPHYRHRYANTQGYAAYLRQFKPPPTGEICLVLLLRFLVSLGGSSLLSQILECHLQYKSTPMLKALLFLLIPVSLFAQEDNWDVYMASYEKGPGSTVINMSAKRQAPDKALAFVVITGVTFKGCTGDGLPAKDQFTDLYSIADSIDKIINTNTKSVHVGTFTYQCQRLDYYYVKDTNNLRSTLQEFYKTRFSKYQPYVNIKEDRSWDAYLSFLYPNEETYEYMSNQKIALKLQESGDKLEKARKVDHWIYFKTETDRNCILPYLKANHFVVESKKKSENLDRPFKLQISRTDKVDPNSITEITLELKRQAAKCNGDYDGWETFVLK